MNGETYILITELEDGDRDVELYTSRPTFDLHEQGACTAARELRVGNLNGGDSITVEKVGNLIDELVSEYEESIVHLANAGPGVAIPLDQFILGCIDNVFDSYPGISDDAVERFSKRLREAPKVIAYYGRSPLADDVMPCGCCSGSCYCDGESSI